MPSDLALPEGPTDQLIETRTRETSSERPEPERPAQRDQLRDQLRETSSERTEPERPEPERPAQLGSERPTQRPRVLRGSALGLWLGSQLEVCSDHWWCSLSGGVCWGKSSPIMEVGPVPSTGGHNGNQCCGLAESFRGFPRWERAEYRCETPANQRHPALDSWRVSCRVFRRCKLVLRALSTFTPLLSLKQTPGFPPDPWVLGRLGHVSQDHHVLPGIGGLGSGCPEQLRTTKSLLHSQRSQEWNSTLEDAVELEL